LVEAVEAVLHLEALVVLLFITVEAEALEA
jgi:hypothetical protein